jgi:hypothetical protein
MGDVNLVRKCVSDGNGLATVAVLRPVGRPSAYDSLKIPAMMSLFANGASKTQVAARVLGVSREGFRLWEKNPPDMDADGNSEFSDAVKLGLTASQSWWEDLAQTAVHDKKVNSSVLIFNLKNRFPKDWREKQDIESVNTTIHEMAPETAKLLAEWRAKG